MRVLVTGATGRVGQRLVPILVGDGHAVRVLQRGVSAGQPAPGENIELIAGSVSEWTDVARAVESIDVISHLAALMPPNNDGEVFTTNVSGTFNILRAMHELAPNARLVFASTDAVYGTGFSERAYPSPIAETAEPRPTNFYGLTKMLCEELVQGHCRLYGLSYVILRYCWVFDGAEALDLFAMPMWEEFMSAGQRARFTGSDAVPVLLEEDGTPFTDHIVDARDVARATALAAVAEDAPGNVLNICSSAEFRYTDVSPTVAGRTNRPLEELRLASFHRYSFDTSRASAVLGFAPEHTVDSMLEEALGRPVSTGAA